MGFPDISTIEPLADALGVTVAEIMKCQSMEEADMKKEEVNAAVESTLDLMKYYEKMDGLKGHCHEKEINFISDICYKFIAHVDESVWWLKRCARNYRND